MLNSPPPDIQSGHLSLTFLSHVFAAINILCVTPVYASHVYVPYV